MATNKTARAKSLAYAAAKRHGVTIEYEVGDRRWTANVCAPEGMEFDEDLTMLCTSWLTKPDETFWADVLKDIVNYAPDMQTIPDHK